jgi:hypothetical protein
MQGAEQPALLEGAVGRIRPQQLPKINASASGISRMMAATVSRFSRRRQRTRLWPSTTTYTESAVTTTMGICWPASANDARRRRSRVG